MLEDAPVSVRLHPLKKTMIQGESIPWCESGRYLSERPIFTLDPFFHGGSYYVQEASSMFLEQVIKQLRLHHKPLRVLDAAAAPGGKSTHLLSLLHPESLLVSNEVIRSRVPILLENIIKWGYPNVVITCNDPADFSTLQGFFDVIVLDAPCSGEGLFRKDPHAIKQWSPEHIILCSRRQQRILNHLWPALKSDGLLIYSTCTFNTSENEQNLLWILSEKKAKPIAVDFPPEWGIVTSTLVTGYRFFPHRLKGEGFFVGVVQKTTAERELPFRARLPGIPQQNQALTHSYISVPFETIFFSQQGKIAFAPAALEQDIARLVDLLHVEKAGTILAEIKHNKVVPQHDVAMSVYLNPDAFPRITFSRDEALSYLRKETLNISAASKGFHLATYNNLPLGWLNALPGRMNNLYPAAWRIRNL